MQVHKGKLRTVPQADLPLDIRIAAKRQRRAFNSWQLGLGPEVLYTPSSDRSRPSAAPAGESLLWCLSRAEPPLVCDWALSCAEADHVQTDDESTNGCADGIPAGVRDHLVPFASNTCFRLTKPR